MKQMTLARGGFERFGRTTKRAAFLDRSRARGSDAPWPSRATSPSASQAAFSVWRQACICSSSETAPRAMGVILI